MLNVVIISVNVLSVVLLIVIVPIGILLSVDTLTIIQPSVVLSLC